ncbi:sulfotransferase [Shewanella sp. Isolate11]|uniref:sulfotransferase family protein n=1 Tax=Shewanella sp. Isolate11 TaxID=2908530 RepID=UPI001EFEADF1|nr:sulfotransferase [Shewanella sp. Isolate11]MCG9697308.1 sulfotransferase [Shewanella sp. Isolate11]
MNSSCFDRPIIILSAPRSGSTLMFEILSHSQSLWTIGGESHHVIEKHRQLNITHKNFESNALDETDWDESIHQALLADFQQQLKDHQQQAYRPDMGPIRFLEKTPKNSLRIPFLNKLFPDALFIYLVRDPKENINSIMQAWQSQRFRTYPGLPGWNGDWSLLLPKQWQTMKGKPLQQVACFQWQQANQSIIDALSQLPRSRWKIVNYRQLINNPTATVKQICEHLEIPFDSSLQTLCSGELPYSRYTVTKPKLNKWLLHYREIESIWPQVQPTLLQINQLLKQSGQQEFDTRWPDELAPAAPQVNNDKYAGTPRNAPCPCGSNKRFKQCHGQLT